jgi:hypothetical protein
MTKPTFPAICIDCKFQIDIIPNEKFLSQAVASALVDPSIFSDNIFYDSGLVKWTHVRSAEKFKPNFFTKFLATSMIYNPVFDVNVTWTNKGTYDLEQLKALLQTCIEKDNDILTQFKDAGILIEKIKKSSSVKQLISIFKPLTKN